MGSDETEYSEIARWYASEYLSHSDARNVVREAFAEEREAIALEREVGGHPVLARPTLGNLLAATRVLVRMTEVMLDTAPADWGRESFVTKVQREAQRIADQISTEIQELRHPTAQESAKTSKR